MFEQSLLFNVTPRKLSSQPQATVAPNTASQSQQKRQSFNIDMTDRNGAFQIPKLLSKTVYKDESQPVPLIREVGVNKRKEIGDNGAVR